MRVKDIICEDFINYKKPSMFIITCFCDLKCMKENKQATCQNKDLLDKPIIDLSNEKIVNMYLTNDITKAIVFGGLEPFLQLDEIVEVIDLLRKKGCLDDIVIYTGYKEEEIREKLDTTLKKYNNIYVKFGRYIPNLKSRYDEVLGVELASSNQYAIKL